MDAPAGVVSLRPTPTSSVQHLHKGPLSSHPAFRSINSTMIVLATVVAVAYLSAVRLLRYRRIKNLTRDLGYEGLTSKQIYERITLTDAQAVQNQMVLWEFPKIMYVSLQFALFKTYAYPSMSALLANTKQLSDSKPSPKRYIDTVILIGEWMRWPLDSERASLAIARTNFLHSQYASSIKAPDFLYTLLMFPVEPVKFISTYEWRQPTELEKASMWRFWHEIGVRMNVPPETIPKNWEAMAEWTEEYEREYMRPAETNYRVGKSTVDLLLWWCPGFAKGFAKQCIYTVLGEPLRKAMMFPGFHPIVPYIVSSVVGTRRLFIRHLCLPRTKPSEKLYPNPNPETGLYQSKVYDVEPWYVPATTSNRYGLWAWYAWATGRPVMEKGKYMESGYRIEDVGPKIFEGKGRDKVLADAERIREMGVGAGHGSGGGACPFKI